MWPFKRNKSGHMCSYVAYLDANAKSYREWADAQVCQGCGAKASDRERDESGVVIGKMWLTEDWCGCIINGGYVDRRPRF